MKSNKLDANEFYMENGRVVFTAPFHVKRGHCCGNGCRHCPYEPKHERYTITLQKEHKSNK
jgi:hypothetical protein